MKLYTAFDVHATNSVVGVLDGDGKRIMVKRLRNDPQEVMSTLEPMRSQIVGVVVESTYNWYWLVDALMEAGYKVHLANPSKIKKYEGQKHLDDRHDAFWLAEMLRLKVLPEGYIYPKQQRPVRDLLRKRAHLVRLRTSLILSLEGIIARNYGVKPILKDIKRLTEDRITPLFRGSDDLHLAGKLSKESIDFLTHQIQTIERVVLATVALKQEYKNLLTIPGVGKILALTIMLETGPIGRFPQVGNYTSYSRKVPTKWTSDGKRKGAGNRKNGNKYLSWAWSEASDHARRRNGLARRYYDRKAQRTNPAVAHNALAHKLARAGYYIMRDGVTFVPDRCFS